MSGAQAQLIILHHTPDDTHIPDPLYAGEPAVCVGPTQTKLWVGEGPPSNLNRLLLSTATGDSPLFNLRSYLPLAGGTLVDRTNGGTGLTISNTSTANPGLILNATGWNVYAARIATSSLGNGIHFQHGGSTAIYVRSTGSAFIAGEIQAGGGISFQLENASVTSGYYAWSPATVIARAFAATRNPPATGGFDVYTDGRVVINYTESTGTALAITNSGTGNAITVNGVALATVPTGGTQYQVLTKGTGTALGWADVGARPDDSTSINSGLPLSSTGWGTVSIGSNAMLANTSGEENVGIGPWTMSNISTGSYNIGVGGSSLTNLVDGVRNTAVGYSALVQLVGNSSHNTGVGNTSGSYFGSAVPSSTNRLTQANDSIYIGHDARALANNPTNEIVIGSGGRGNGSNTVTLGNAAITGVFTSGSVTAAGTLLTSDPALKKDIRPAKRGALAKVNALQVIDYRWKREHDTKLHRGFSAVDVANVMGEDSGCVGDGSYSLADMNAVLWQAVQELSAEVTALCRHIHL